MGAGAPVGNQNRANSKRWAAALERAFAAWPEEPDTTDCSALMIGLNNAAHKFVANTMAGDDIAYFRETGDRIDGKAHQSATIDGTGTDGAILLETLSRPKLSKEEWLAAHAVGTAVGSAE